MADTMANLVHYHHPVAENFSLQYSSLSLSAVLDRQEDLDGDTKLVRYPFETPVYVLYEGTPSADVANDIDFDREWLTDRAVDLPRSGQVVTFRLVELLAAAVSARQDEAFRLYKEFQPEQIQRALERVSWGESLPTVAGELMSNLILRHALPNANHRTSIAMLQFCIESVDTSFEMPTTHVDDETWQTWVDPYIVESKRLITVRRNNVRFKHLQELDVDIVERKGGIQIRLSDYELDMHWREALSTYASRHEDHCTDFALAVLEQSNRSDLLNRNGPTQSEFVDYLESGVVERDFEELF